MISNEKANKPAVVVVAMSGVLPRAVGPEQFWQNIITKIDGSIEIPDDRRIVPPAWVYDDSPVADKAYSRRACLVRGFDFDPGGYHLAAEELSRLDALHQWVLFAAKDALNRLASTPPRDPRRCGVILAAIALPTALASRHARLMLDDELQQQWFGRQTRYLLDKTASSCGRVVSSPAALISRALGLRGPSYTLDAACAASLYALKLACDKLQNDDADLMLAGGVSAADSLYTQIGFSQLRALSRSGRCAPFDHRADGLLVGEGAGILVLKRLTDALAHNDKIYGIIRGIGLSNDMRGNLLAPESAGQLRAMQSAYTDAGWSPTEVDYIECHGAGTPVGDATELNSLRTLWQSENHTDGRCALGAVKSMVGHLLTGAGAAGLMRTLLALHHRTLPPTLNFERPAPNSPLIDGPFRIPVAAEPWDRSNPSRSRRAAVSAFGFGGINAHVLIEAFEPESTRQTGRGRLDRRSDHHRPPLDHSANRNSADAPVCQETPVAVVGLEVTLGSLTSLQSFENAVFTGTSALAPVPASRWKTPRALEALLGGLPGAGAYVAEIPVSIGEFQIPPGELRDILPQQLLMLKTAAGAMHDAGLPLREARPRMGTIIGIGFDYEAANFHLRWSLPQAAQEWIGRTQTHVDQSLVDRWLADAREGCGPPLTAVRTVGALGGIVASRIAREFRCGGPSFVVSAEEASGLRALEIGCDLLRQGILDTVLVGAVDLHCDERNLSTIHPRLTLSRTNRVAPFDRQADGTLPGEGAVALVLKRLDEALADGSRIYAVIKGIGSAGGGAIAPETTMTSLYAESLQNALLRANVSPEQITLMETHGSGVPYQDDCEAEALHGVFAKKILDFGKEIAVGTLKSLVGHCGAVSGLASLVKASLSLHHRMLAPSAAYQSPRQPVWGQSPFYFPRKATYWARNRDDGPRHAGVAAMTHDGGCMHVILTQSPRGVLSERIDFSSTRRKPESGAMIFENRSPLGALPHALFLLHASAESDLAKQLDHLSGMAHQSDEGQSTGAEDRVEALAYEWYQYNLAGKESKAGLNLAIVADSAQALQEHIAKARQALRDRLPQQLSRNGGVVYFPSLSECQGKTAFVFPGSGNHYLGMGRDLAARWPGVMRHLDAGTTHLLDQLLPQLYDPRRSDWPPGWQSASYQELISNPLNTIFGQVLFGGQMTHLLRSFGVKPDAVIGYSLGESAGLFALGAWPDRGQMLSRLKTSDLFKDQLSGDFKAVRQAWGLPDAQKIDWHVVAVNRPARVVDQAIADLPYVRRLIINTPEECVIGGLKEHVDQAVTRLGCESVVLDGVVAVHCDAAQPVAKAYRDLHVFDTEPVPDVIFYSCAQARSYALSSDAAADAILDQALHGFDFPATIAQAYADGIRLFIEIGPHASCSRMIDQILPDRPHLAVSASNRSEMESLCLLKCLGTLAAAGLPIDLAPLYGHQKQAKNAALGHPNQIIRVPVGGKAFDIPPPPAPTVHNPAVSASRATVSANDLSAEMLRGTPGLNLSAVLHAFDQNVAHTAQAHDQFLELSQELRDQLSDALKIQQQLLEKLASLQNSGHGKPNDRTSRTAPPIETPLPPVFSREQCLEFAIGSVGRVLGPEFDIVDSYAARVRLPDEPLMLVDRIVSIAGVPRSLGAGSIVTEHDVLPDAWYLDGGRAPVCISVEAGQADLFLSAYLGIDHEVKGRRTYRLLDAKIVFHRGLPQPGETIRYDIHIDKFVRQGETYLFFFHFEGCIAGRPLITMTDGCAGFFTEQEVHQSGGIFLTHEDRHTESHALGSPYEPLVPLQNSNYDDDRLDALRSGDAAGCFGRCFHGVFLPHGLRLPVGRMRLIDRIITLEPQGGRFGKGYIKAEADIHPDDWFLTCHFVDDRVMPGTLMYECCAHTLRVMLLRLGWVTDKEGVCYEPVQGVPCALKCRGPVTPQTRKVHYAVEIKEIGYRPEPYVVADAHMYADGRYIVFFKDMSMQLTGLNQAEVSSFWRERACPARLPCDKPPLFDRERILEFAVGNPSKAFGKPYAVFDRQRKIARLPGPPYCFIDRILAVEPPPWKLQPGGWVTAQYDVPADGWYFGADRSGCMPFAVLLEIALQPCGWLAAYLGSALKSPNDLKFRNLGGCATINSNILPENNTLTMRARLTKVAEAGEMIIEHFDFQVLTEGATLYTGSTYFGFFTYQALAQQKGLQEGFFTPGKKDLLKPDTPLQTPDSPDEPDDVVSGRPFDPSGLRMPARALAMLDTIDGYAPHGGPHGLGFIRGGKKVNPAEWFFKAHFFQDPVCPGSLGIESFLQLIKYAAIDRWPELVSSHRFEPLCGYEHQWSYRGQVIPDNRKVTVDAVVNRIEEGDTPVIMADGWLHVDGLCIYKMNNFGLRLLPLNPIK